MATAVSARWITSVSVRILLVIPLLLASCTSPGEDAEAAIASPDWIELPLVENAYYEFEGGFRQDTVTVTIAGGGEGLEVDLEMAEGETIVYTWSADGLASPDQLLVEFHGHTESAPGEPGTVMFYRQANAVTGHGSLRAPFTGTHAWYFRNDSDAPVVITLVVAGFYRLADSAS